MFLFCFFGGWCFLLWVFGVCGALGVVFWCVLFGWGCVLFFGGCGCCLSGVGFGVGVCFCVFIFFLVLVYLDQYLQHTTVYIFVESKCDEYVGVE